MNAWPELPIAEWADTCATLHLWTQVVGKIRLAHAPLVNHWWQVPLYVTSRGLTTSMMPYGARGFQIDFDFIDHALVIRTSDGATDKVALAPRSVADFHAEVMGRLRALGLKHGSGRCRSRFRMPSRSNRTHARRLRCEYAQRFWRVLVQADRVCTIFRVAVPRQGEPGAFLLGQLRPRGHPIFRPRRADMTATRPISAPG